MKNNFYVEFDGNQLSEQDVIKRLKENWISRGRKIKDIKDTEIYFKIEDNTAYCVVNKTEKIDIVF